MKNIIVLIILFISLPCFAQEATKIPDIQGFSVAMDIEKAESNCLALENSTWEKLEKSGYPGTFYGCKATVKNNYVKVGLYAVNNIVQSIKLETDYNICTRMKKRLNQSACFKDKRYWSYCAENWIMNCTHMHEKKVNVIDLLLEK